MGLWENTAFIASADYVRVSDEIAKIAVAEGRQPVTPPPRVRQQYDDMQYKMDPARWGFAIFPGAPGWTVIKTASLEILLSGSEDTRIVKLARAVGCPAFQLNAYDGDSILLYECDPMGAVEVSGYCSVDPERYQRNELTEENATARFRNPAVRAAVAEACRREVDFVQGGLVELRSGDGPLVEQMNAMAAATRRWLQKVGGEITPLDNSRITGWRAPASAVVARWLDDHPVHLGVDTDCAAFRLVFAGQNEPFADNLISVCNLVEHNPLPVERSCALYFDRTD